MKKKMAAALESLPGMLHVYAIDKADIEFTESEPPRFFRIETITGESESVSFVDDDPNEGTEPKRQKRFELSFEVSYQDAREWRWNHICSVAPWVKRNFVKETITHKIEY